MLAARCNARLVAKRAYDGPISGVSAGPAATACLGPKKATPLLLLGLRYQHSHPHSHHHRRTRASDTSRPARRFLSTASARCAASDAASAAQAVPSGTAQAQAPEDQQRPQSNALNTAHHATGGLRAPGLAVLLTSTSRDSHQDMERKGEVARSLGFVSTTHLFDEATVTRRQLIQRIHELNEDPTVDGILVQLPLPPHLADAEPAILSAVLPRKDVDGFQLIDRSGNSPGGNHVMVLGRSATVGLPITPRAPTPHAATAASSAVPPAGVPVVDRKPGWPFLSAHPRVLVLTKTPRYEHEKNSSGLRGQDLHEELSKLGFISDRLEHSYLRHMDSLNQLTQALQHHAMKVVVKHVDSASRADLDGIDLIISAGGDGTMLKAAALLGFQERSESDDPAAMQYAVPVALSSSTFAPTNPSSSSSSAYPLPSFSSPPTATPGMPYIPIPLIGVNTDPQHSSGVLCAFSIEGSDVSRVIEHLRRSHFCWLEKSRIEITLVDKSGTVTLVPQYAYNDVVVAERDPGRPIVYELTVDDHPPEIQRSSGVLVCTGTGSTAWMSNAAAVHPDQVTAVLKGIGHTHSSCSAREIADRINQELVFETNSPEVEFLVREPLLPAVGRGGYQHRHGWAGRVSVRSLGWDAVISIDGINLVKLPKGTTAILQIGRKPGANLTVLSLAGPGGQPSSRQ